MKVVRKLKIGVIVWTDARFSDLQNLPSLPTEKDLSFGLIQEVNKNFVRVGMNCKYDVVTKQLRVVDGILIPRKTVKKIIYFHGKNF